MSWRHDNLSWAHHCEVGLAFDNPDDIRCWLDVAAKEYLSSRELRRRIRLYLVELELLAKFVDYLCARSASDTGPRLPLAD